MTLIDKDALKKDILDLPNCYNGFSDTYDKACIIGVIDEQPTIEERKWIPVKTRPMTDEEREYYEEYYGHLCENEAVMFDCPMPDDEQEVWVCSECGNVWQDACVVDIGIGLEGNGDWFDIVAWMPYEKPQPYSEEK